MKKYIKPKYIKLGTFTSSQIISLHNRLNPESYVLNLEALVPKDNGIIPDFINLIRIHKPKSYSDFKAAKSEFLALKAFLRLVLMKDIDRSRIQLVAKQSSLDISFLKRFTADLPFELSLSQKNIIWEIVNELSGD